MCMWRSRTTLQYVLAFLPCVRWSLFPAAFDRPAGPQASCDPPVSVLLFSMGVPLGIWRLLLTRTCSFNVGSGDPNWGDWPCGANASQTEPLLPTASSWCIFEYDHIKITQESYKSSPIGTLKIIKRSQTLLGCCFGWDRLQSLWTIYQDLFPCFFFITFSPTEAWKEKRGLGRPRPGHLLHEAMNSSQSLTPVSFHILRQCKDVITHHGLG